MLWPLVSNAQQNDLRISDDGYAHVPLDFTFPFYGNFYNDAYMMSNGVVGFLNPGYTYCCNGIDLNNNQQGPWNFAILGLWTDLLNYNGRFYEEGDETYQLFGWENISEYGRPNNLNTFSIEITPDGAIGMQHDMINITGHSYTIGIIGDYAMGEYVQYEFAPTGGTFTDTTFDPTVPSPVDQCSTDPLYSPDCDGYIDAYFALQCTNDPLYDVNCNGYAEAFYAQQCSMDPLYDSGCPGYDEAYYIQQCSLDALYDTGCIGYEEAYFSLQCSLDALYDTGCPGYEQAYYLYECSLDPLYDTGCDGYQEAFIAQMFDLSCSLDPLYDTQCPGYLEASLAAQAQEMVSEVVEDPIAAITSPVAETAATLFTEQVAQDEIVMAEIVEAAPAIEDIAPIEMTVDEKEEAEAVEEIEKELEQESSSGNRESVRAAVVERAKNLASTIGAAVSVEQQKAVQAQVLALISFVPGFDTYSGSINGGVYPDGQLYDPTVVPESRTGLRNGLAQQILHTKMVDMQYGR